MTIISDLDNILESSIPQKQYFSMQFSQLHVYNRDEYCTA